MDACLPGVPGLDCSVGRKIRSAIGDDYPHPDDSRSNSFLSEVMSSQMLEGLSRVGTNSTKMADFANSFLDFRFRLEVTNVELAMQPGAEGHSTNTGGGRGNVEGADKVLDELELFLKIGKPDRA